MSAAQKVVVITGASQGIGAELVKAFRERGHRVVATARTIKPSDDQDILAVAGDIADPSTARRVIAEAVARFGRIDTLVNTPASSSPSRSPAIPTRTTRPPPAST